MIWLERKYLAMASAHLDLAKWKNDNTLNHRCPYCGDSSKKKNKSRGYHFVVDNSFVYKCHNCGKSTSSVNFLKDHFSILYKEYKKEWLKENGRAPKKRKMPSSNMFKFKPKIPLKKGNALDEICISAWDDPNAKDYLTKRGIPTTTELWYVDNAEKLAEINDKYKDRYLGNDPRIVLPFFSEDGELIGITGRAINDAPLRYLTMRLSEELPLIYNYDKVDKSKTIYVTEGPIDSLFLPNSIAVAGSDFKKIDNTIKENAILVYDNEPRNIEIIKKISDVIDLGYSVCIWNDKRVYGLKDINDMMDSGLSQDELIQIINECTYNGLSAKAKLMEYKKK